MEDKKDKFLLWFKDVSIDDTPLVGGKNAALGEMYGNLTKLGINIPNGFALTAKAYWYFLNQAGIKEKIEEILKDLDHNNIQELQKRGEKVRQTITDASLPGDLKSLIKEAYQKLIQDSGSQDVAVRSSATAEDLPTASFAGQQETYLNVKGLEEVLVSAKKCIASLFTNRAISYRADKGFKQTDVALSVGIQKMVRSDKGASGVNFTIDPETGVENIIYLTSAWGLGEMIVQGKVEGDEFYVFKEGLRKGHRAIVAKKQGSKERKLIYDESGNKMTKDVPVEKSDREKFTLTDDEILKLAKWSLKIEEHFSKKAGETRPMDIEWAKDGISGELYIVQARPETVQSQRNVNEFSTYYFEKQPSQKDLLVTGDSVGNKISQGKVRIIKSVEKINQFQEGEVLVTEMTDPDWEPIMKEASAIITNKGGRTCFAGDTLVLTNKEFISMKELYETAKDQKNTYIYSYDYKRNKPVWKKIVSIRKNKRKAIRITLSQTGRMKNNSIDLTPDHKVYTYQNRKLVKKPIDKILQNQEMVCLADKLPKLPVENNDCHLAYLLGALASDGNIYFHPGTIVEHRRGTVTFTQKNAPRKEEFISTVNSYFQECFGQNMKRRVKRSHSLIRNRVVTGVVDDYKCYNLKIATRIQSMMDNLGNTVLSFSEEATLSFLAGILDGDGSFYKNRIQLYVGKKNILRAIIISCLNLGFVPQVTNNRNIYNVQIVERMSDILKFSKKIKDIPKKKQLGTKLFAARQLFQDVSDKVNYKGRIKPYVDNNLLIDAQKIKQNILPQLNGSLKKELKEIISSPLRMWRAKYIKDLNKIDVYNIEVEADNELDHNYVVFSKKYTPLLVSNSHAAIVSRELGIPAIVGTIDATEKLKDGQMVTVDCTGSEVGRVYTGQHDFKKKTYELKKVPKTKTKLMLNIGSPEQAMVYHSLPVQGVGLAREEFIIASEIQIHPKALMEYDKIKKGSFKNAKKATLKKIATQIKKLTKGYDDKEDYYVEKLTAGVAKIGAAFWPRQVIVRFSDFKTNEYRSLLGGDLFEPDEENPMIGWRGASRYTMPDFEDAFGLECQAIKRAREEIGLKNIDVMVPFCRTPEEGRQVLKLMEKFGLSKGRLKVYVMCEIPANVIQAYEFLEHFDGFSIGTNDLTQLTLGMDRDNAKIADISNENNESVKEMVRIAIRVARELNKYSGICGQAPSDYPDFAKFLVKNNIESISLNPDTVIPLIKKVAKWEKEYY